MRRGSSPIPASQRGWNLAGISIICSGLLQGKSTSMHFRPEEDQSIWSKHWQCSNPVVKLVETCGKTHFMSLTCESSTIDNITNEVSQTAVCKTTQNQLKYYTVQNQLEYRTIITCMSSTLNRSQHEYNYNLQDLPASVIRQHLH